MKAAVLGAGSESLHTIHKARELGQKVIAIDGNPEAAGLRAADRGFYVDISDEEQVIKVAEHEKVDFLLTPPIGRVLKCVGAVNDALGLPGISKEAALLCTDKYLFHRRLWEEKLRDCHCYLAGKEKGELSYPAILKPRFGSGSRDIFWVKDERELRQALRAIANRAGHTEEDYVLEEAVPGTEYGVDGALDEEGFHLILLRRKLLTPPPARQAVGYLTVVPEEEELLVRQVRDHLSRVTDALRLRDCLFHADLMVRENRIFVIESSARPSGHNLHNIFTPLASGIDMAEEYIKCRIGQAYSYHPVRIGKMMIRYFDFSGRVASVPDEEAVRSLTEKNSGVRICRWECGFRPGDELGPVTDGHSLMSRGFFILEGNTDEELRRGGEELLKLFDLRKEGKPI